MAVSPALQKYFDARRPKKDDTQKKLNALAGQIDPAFMMSFEDFRERILGIVEEFPEAETIVENELTELQDKFGHIKRKHDLKKASIFVGNEKIFP